MYYEQILEGAQALAQAVLVTGTQHPAEALGLDARIGNLTVGEDWIAASGRQVRTLNHYGGFGYIDDEHKTKLADTVFYFRDNDRVDEALTNLEYNND